MQDHLGCLNGLVYFYGSQSLGWGGSGLNLGVTGVTWFVLRLEAKLGNRMARCFTNEKSPERLEFTHFFSHLQSAITSNSFSSFSYREN